MSLTPYLELGENIMRFVLKATGHTLKMIQRLRLHRGFGESAFIYLVKY
jgi:hypothetical protein